MPPRLIAKQLSQPSGWLGRLVGHLMNRHNSTMNGFVMQRLAPSPSDRVLEVGFGGGVLFSSLIGRARLVAGVDRSPLMVEQARRHYRRFVASGNVVLHVGRVEALPFDTGSFDKVFSMNTIYFWSSLEAGFREIGRVLAPGGQALIGFLPAPWMDSSFPADIFTSRNLDDVVAALTAAGFENVRIERPKPETRWQIVVATRTGLQHDIGTRSQEGTESIVAALGTNGSR